jgi:hypothetical protein
MNRTHFRIVYFLVQSRKKSISLRTPRRTGRFPIDIDQVIAISRDLRKIELVVEFERR